MKKILYIIIILLSLINIQAPVYANEHTLESQRQELGINEFIKNAKEYTGEFFEGIDISDLLNSAIEGKVDNATIFKRILNLFGQEVTNGLKAVVSIIAIIIIHSILKSVSESLENDNISKLIYYVQYILIITVIMTNFSDIIKMVQDTSTNLVAFINILTPLLITLMLYTGSIATSGMLEPIILFIINFIGNLIENVLIPLVLILTSLIIISKISDKVKIDKISKFLKSGIVWFLGVVLTIFVGVVSLEGTLSSSIDGITAKTTKAVVSSAIPVVGKILSDSVDTVLGCGIILKNAVGIVGVLIVVGICVMPIIKLAILSTTYKFLASVTQPIADKNITSLLEQIGDIFKILLAILSALAVLLIIGTALTLKMSNSGMMYR